MALEREWARRKALATVPAVPRRRQIIGISAFRLAAVGGLRSPGPERACSPPGGWRTRRS
ncbi:hypothetical protein C0Q98_18780 [Streptomyces albidoflavus]|nr:hypothetical protein C0Q98_18780 [Streptomyces albidoflavus]